MRHNIFVTKPPQRHPTFCSPPPRNSTLASKARSLLLLESLGTPGPATVLVTVDKSQTFLLHLPRVEWREAKLGSRVPKEKESLCAPVHSLKGRLPFLAPLSP